MHQLEVVAKNQEEAIGRAAKKLELPEGELEVIEEYEPDELDLKTYQEEEGLEATPSSSDVTLFMVRVSLQHYIRRAGEFTQGLIERFAPGSKAEAVPFRDIIIVRLEVPEASILIGKQGATLDALQHVVIRCLLTEDEDFPDVMLDIERYREKKLIRLEREARVAAERAVRSGRRVPLSPMSPAERKIIHNSLKGFEGIRTESRGEDRGRHIVIEPTNAGQRRRGGQGGGDRRGGGNRGGGNRGGGNRGGNRGGGQRDGNRDGNRDGDRDGNRESQLPRKKFQPITEEQRSLLYGNVGSAEQEADFEDTELEERRSLLPEYQGPEETDEDDDSQKRFIDEIE